MIENNQHLYKSAQSMNIPSKIYRSNRSHVSKVSRHQLTKTQRIHRSKTVGKSRIIIHTQLRSSSLSTSENRNKNINNHYHPDSISYGNQNLNNSVHSVNNNNDDRRQYQLSSQTKSENENTKIRSNTFSSFDDQRLLNNSISSNNDHHRKRKVIPYNATDEWSCRIRSADEFRQIIEHTKKRKKLKQLSRSCCPCSFWCLIFFLFIALILGLILAVLLVKFLPTTSSINTTEFSSTTSTSITTVTTTTTTTRPTGAISKYAIVTASYFNLAGGLATDQADGLVDRQPSGPAFVSNYAPQYVQLELPDEYNISKICLLISQSPNGATHHQLSVGASLNSTQLVTDLNGTTYGGQWINLTYIPPLNNVRFLRLNTITSPSWVSWVKFLVYDV